MLKEATVCYLLRETSKKKQILLGERDSHFQDGLWNGPGGKYDFPGEKPFECAERELEQEIGVRIHEHSSTHFATIDYYRPNTKPNGAFVFEHYDHDWRVHFFLVSSWSGKIRPVEGFSLLHWYDVDRLPFEAMPINTRLWLLDSMSIGEECKRRFIQIFFRDRTDDPVVDRAVFSAKPFP